MVYNERYLKKVIDLVLSPASVFIFSGVWRFMLAYFFVPLLSLPQWFHLLHLSVPTPSSTSPRLLCLPQQWLPYPFHLFLFHSFFSTPSTSLSFFHARVQPVVWLCPCLSISCFPPFPEPGPFVYTWLWHNIKNFGGDFFNTQGWKITWEKFPPIHQVYEHSFFLRYSHHCSAELWQILSLCRAPRDPQLRVMDGILGNRSLAMSPGWCKRWMDDPTVSGGQRLMNYTHTNTHT